MFTKKRVALLIIIVVVCVAVPILAAFRGKGKAEGDTGVQVLTLWQVDGFEGGKGSRAQYLTNKAEECFDGQNIFVRVTTLSAESARENMKSGVLPDMISYSPTLYGIESAINRTDFAFKTWCHGTYCLLTLEENCAFDDVTETNTVINAGKDNLVEVTAALLGLTDAPCEAPTNAYLKLLSGKYKYLLGSQRDIFRLQTRGVSYSAKCVTQFNDLYQNISVVTHNNERYASCKEFISYLTENADDTEKIGLLSESVVGCAEELTAFVGVTYEKVLNTVCGEEYLNELKQAAQSKDVNKIKSLVKGID